MSLSRLQKRKEVVSDASYDRNQAKRSMFSKEDQVNSINQCPGRGTDPTPPQAPIKISSDNSHHALWRSNQKEDCLEGTFQASYDNDNGFPTEMGTLAFGPTGLGAIYGAPTHEYYKMPFLKITDYVNNWKKELQDVTFYGVTDNEGDPAEQGNLEAKGTATIVHSGWDTFYAGEKVYMTLEPNTAFNTETGEIISKFHFPHHDQVKGGNKKLYPGLFTLKSNNIFDLKVSMLSKITALIGNQLDRNQIQKTVSTFDVLQVKCESMITEQGCSHFGLMRDWVLLTCYKDMIQQCLLHILSCEANLVDSYMVIMKKCYNQLGKQNQNVIDFLIQRKEGHFNGAICGSITEQTSFIRYNKTPNANKDLKDLDKVTNRNNPIATDRTNTKFPTPLQHVYNMQKISEYLCMRLMELIQITLDKLWCGTIMSPPMCRPGHPLNLMIRA